MKKIILASTSPRRQDLLAGLGLVFECISPSFEENILKENFSYEDIEQTALGKARSVAIETKDSALIISADTVVIENNFVLGKPKDKTEAFKMLNQLSGKTHTVVTAIAVVDTDKKREILESTTSFVTFKNLSNELINYYVEEYSPLDKAGAYGIQELPDGFVEKIEGDFDNIMGLPTKTLIKMLTTINN
ncbi:MAG: Maf family protein [Candidatus Gastranaerophilales bacterium]|nr:Maf family protein [Candidatus Gastranaerophilales bacterium]